MSWIRNKPFREGAIEGLPFSPGLVPLAAHPRVAESEDHQLKTLGYRLLAHLHFTTLLELDHIAPICSDLALGRSGVALTDAQRHDAMRIFCDEGAHALFVDTFALQVERTYDLDRSVVGHPQFDSILRSVSSSVPDALIKLFFVAISETLVTKVLFGIPRDEAVAPLVRQVLEDHGADEAAHAGYFRALFAPMWRAVPEAHREALGRILPRLVWTFLCPDRNLEARILHSFGCGRREADRILDEVYPPNEVAADVRKSARQSLVMFEEAGVLASPAIREAFAEYELIDVAEAPPPAKSGAYLIWGQTDPEEVSEKVG